MPGLDFEEGLFMSLGDWDFLPTYTILLIFDGGFKLLHPLVALFAVHAGKQDRH